eukprot:5604083-Prymnesium_polylepis.1
MARPSCLWCGRRVASWWCCGGAAAAPHNHTKRVGVSYTDVRWLVPPPRCSESECVRETYREHVLAGPPLGPPLLMRSQAAALDPQSQCERYTAETYERMRDDVVRTS